ncbi:hypothetical protein V8C34DRAFT_297701 [Trichoderma compactum]
MFCHGSRSIARERPAQGSQPVQSNCGAKQGGATAFPIRKARRRPSSDDCSSAAPVAIKEVEIHAKACPFLKAVDEYGKVVEVFGQTPELLGFIWGPLKYVLTIASTLSEAYSSLVGVYADIGEQMPLLSSYQSLFFDNAHMRTLLVILFQDILVLHREALKFFKQKLWRQLFQATWKGFVLKVQDLKDSLGRYRQLIESRVTIVEIEEMRSLRRTTEAKLNSLQKADIARRKAAVRSFNSCPLLT